MESNDFQTGSGFDGLGGVCVKERFDEIFDMEVQCWCYGFARYPGNLNQELVHRVVREMAPTFKAAVQHNHIFDLIETAERIAKSTRYVISTKEAAFSILIQLPTPFELDEEAQFVLAQIIDQGEMAYGDVLMTLEKRWRRDRKVRTN